MTDRELQIRMRAFTDALSAKLATLNPAAQQVELPAPRMTLGIPPPHIKVENKVEPAAVNITPEVKAQMDLAPVGAALAATADSFIASMQEHAETAATAAAKGAEQIARVFDNLIDRLEKVLTKFLKAIENKKAPARPPVTFRLEQGVDGSKRIVQE